MKPPKPELIPRNHKVGCTVHANRGVELAYRKKLTALVDVMQQSVMYWLEASYKKVLPEVMAYDAALSPVRRLVNRLLPVFDASPARDMQRQLRRRMRQWQREFDGKAQDMSRWFTRSAAGATTAALGSSVGQVAGLTVRFKTTRAVNNALQSIVLENASLIRSLPQKYFLEIEGLVMRSVREGRNLGFLTDELEKRFSITRHRAETIARDQNNKATEAIGRVRMQELGIKQAVWIHSGGGKHPRSSHVAANGKVFDLAKGLLIDGEYIHPGEKINCRCSKRPVIAAFAQSQRDLARENGDQA